MTWLVVECVQDANVEFNLLYLVCIFFVLSFGFQLAVMIPCRGGYQKIFTGKEDDDVPFEWADDKTKWLERMLYFNWLRFVEYSISGSLVLLIVGMISGILDIELLACIFVLSAACMIFGLVAEWSLRIYVVLKHSEQDMEGTTKHVIMRQLTMSFWLAHILAWICIMVPWYIIIQHYMGWFNQCGSPEGTSQPPDFVKAIVWLQVILFTSFGVVQVMQWFYPHKRRVAEIIYISLSFIAKGLLGLILAFTVIMQD